MDREKIIRRFRDQVNQSGHIIGAAVGSGLTAKLAALGGADILLVLSAGKYRIMGRSSFSSYFCYGNNNSQVMELGKREIFPIVRDVPLLFGLMATDPTIQLYDYLQKIKAAGFSGVVNFPTVSLIDGKFREALEEEGTTFDREVAAIKLANHFEMFTVAFVTNEEETRQMLVAEADVICVHLGLTRGGFLGAKKYISIDDAQKSTKKIFDVCRKLKPETFCMIYAGPANTLADMKYLFHNTECQGYIGGSTFDRIPIEQTIFDTVRNFKRGSENSEEGSYSSGKISIDFLLRHVEENYFDKISFAELADSANISRPYLSQRFKEEVGISFSEYLLSFRLNKAKELLEREQNISCKEVALQVGYSDYAQFTKMFKKFIGESPSDYQKRCACV